ncbi:GGDEF domain-containing protein [Lacimicrobium sp. SS2-24]|uniref:GGDEF domain-containing protein n=1 Tax=Lacimicrobium sp. SS2-24 TaxID=2005569 RepID=UPI000B4B05A6|nr:GGDEF domain-containing protein [Lacimicrobium sp. SS2-24]
MDLTLYKDTFTLGFFVLILTSVIACSFVIGKVSKAYTYTPSLRLFQVYFLMGSIGFLGTWLAVEGILPTLLGGSVVAYCVACATLYLGALNLYSPHLIHTLRVTALTLLCSVSAVTLGTIKAFVFIEAFFALMLFPYLFYALVRRGHFRQNCGTALLLLALFVVILAAFFQLGWLGLSEDIKFVFAVTVFSQSVSFVLVGLGVTTSLLIDEKKKMTELSFKDPLTDLYNRRGMERQFQKEPFRRSAFSIAIDIDHFKRINDTYGHEAGDEVLTKVAALLKSEVRENDICCRLGGEEFIILLAEVNVDIAMQLAKRLRTAIAAFAVNYQDQIIQFTASFGVAECLPQETLHALIKRADLALYQAKSAGRNQVVQAH